MKTYKVTITESAVFERTVKAQSVEQAEKLAIAQHVADKNPERFFQYVEDREATAKEV